jgi:hypothetical protein
MEITAFIDSKETIEKRINKLIITYHSGYQSQRRSGKIHSN